jgi:hypothetical protein
MKLVLGHYLSFFGKNTKNNVHVHRLATSCRTRGRLVPRRRRVTTFDQHVLSTLHTPVSSSVPIRIIT